MDDLGREDGLPDLIPCGKAKPIWFDEMGEAAYYGALNRGDIPAKKLGGKWFVLKRPWLRILEGESTS